MTLPSLAPPGALLDALLRRAPLDVLLFDADLVCRYAALADESLLGRTAAEFVGEPAEAIFGRQAGDLLAALRLAAGGGSSYDYRDYRYTFQESEAHTFYCWSVRVEPVAFHDYRGRAEFEGALVTLADVADLADERDRLRDAEARLLAETADLALKLRAREERAVALQARVRDLLAPLSGYLQVLARRPAVLADEPVTSVAERLLGRVAEIVAAVDEAARPPDGAPGPR